MGQENSAYRVCPCVDNYISYCRLNRVEQLGQLFMSRLCLFMFSLFRVVHCRKSSRFAVAKPVPVAQKVWCLNDNGPHKLMCLNALSLVGGTIWEGIRGVALLEEVLKVHTVLSSLCVCVSHA